MASSSVQSSSCSWPHFVAGCIGAIEPADLQRRFPKTFPGCIVVPNSNWVKCLDPDRTKTSEEWDALLSEDRELFIQVSVVCSGAFLPPNTADRFSEKKRASAAKKICCGSCVLMRSLRWVKSFVS